MSAVAVPRSRTTRIVLAVVGALVLANLVLATIERATGAPSGPPSSSYATAPHGLAAWAGLLEQHGHTVDQVREPISDTRLDPATTVVVLDAAEISPRDAEALAAFVTSGGRLVAGGRDPSWLRMLMADPPVWSPEAIPAPAVVAPAPEVAGVRSVVVRDLSAWATTGAALPVIAGARGTLLAVHTMGEGRIVLLSSASPLYNALIAREDNAALGLALVGEPGRRVVFEEYGHGYTQGTGFGAIPSRVRWALGGLALAAVVFMIGRGRRFGPPEAAARALAPPRRLFVDSLAQTLARTRRRADAVAIVQRAAWDRIVQRTGLAIDASPEDVAEAGTAVGLSDEEARALTSAAASDRDVVLVGRALAKTMGRSTGQGTGQGTGRNT
jgi:hypothetical protein